MLVVVIHHEHGRHSEVMVEQRTAHVYTLRDGKVSGIEVWSDPNARESALEAVGLRE